MIDDQIDTGGEGIAGQFPTLAESCEDAREQAYHLEFDIKQGLDDRRYDLITGVDVRNLIEAIQYLSIALERITTVEECPCCGRDVSAKDN